MENEFHRAIRRLRNAVASQRGVLVVDRPRIMLPRLRDGSATAECHPRRKASELATAVDFVAAEPNTL